MVFVGFIKTGEKLVSILRNKGIKADFFYGELEEAQREKLIEKLWSKEEDRIDVLVSTDAAYVGLNLQIADTIIHHDFSWNPMVVEQRIGRIHRIGQKKPVTSYSFLCQDTIDERKHKILTQKLEEISTHLGMSYSVVLTEVALSSEIEKIMADYELREIEEKELEERLKKHITERKEIFELLEELPAEEVEIIQVSFATELVDKIEAIIKEIVKMSKKLLNFRIKPIIEDNDFFILEYQRDGKKLKELATLNDKALINISLDTVKEWKRKYEFQNINPSYIGPFHYIVDRACSTWIENNKNKFFKKVVGDKKLVALYLILPLTIKNFTANIEVSFELFVPVLYDLERNEVEIKTQKVYELAISSGKIEDIDEKNMVILEKAKKCLYSQIENIKNKVRANIEKVKIEMEELALRKHRVEIETKIKEKRRKLENLNREIVRRRNSGLRYEKEMFKAKRLKEELINLQKKLELTPQSNFTIEFKNPELIGGCIYY